MAGVGVVFGDVEQGVGEHARVVIDEVRLVEEVDGKEPYLFEAEVLVAIAVLPYAILCR